MMMATLPLDLSLSLGIGLQVIGEEWGWSPRRRTRLSQSGRSSTSSATFDEYDGFLLYGIIRSPRDSTRAPGSKSSRPSAASTGFVVWIRHGSRLSSIVRPVMRLLLANMDTIEDGIVKAAFFVKKVFCGDGGCLECPRSRRTRT